MAKFNITVELDWMEIDPESGGYSIDDEVKEHLASTIFSKIKTSAESDINKAIQDKVEQASNSLSESIDDQLNTMMSDFLEKRIVITDNYGDKVEEHENVREMMKEKFDDFMTQKVDENGNRTNQCSYGKKYTRVEHFITSIIKEKANSWTQGVIKDVDKRIEEAMSQAAKEQLAEKIQEKLDI